MPDELDKAAADFAARRRMIEAELPESEREALAKSKSDRQIALEKKVAASSFIDLVDMAVATFNKTPNLAYTLVEAGRGSGSLDDGIVTQRSVSYAISEPSARSAGQSITFEFDGAGEVSAYTLSEPDLTGMPKRIYFGRRDSVSDQAWVRTMLASYFESLH